MVEINPDEVFWSWEYEFDYDVDDILTWGWDSGEDALALVEYYNETVKRLERDDIFAWFNAFLTGTYMGIQRHWSLCQCSFEDEDEFRKEHDAEAKAEVLAELNEAIQEIINKHGAKE